MTDIRKLINILEAIEQKSVTPEDPHMKEIAQDIKQGQVSDNVLMKLRQFLSSIVNSDKNADAVQQPQIAEPAATDEPKVDEADERKLGSADMQVYALLKEVNPERADQVWAFYNKQMIADYIVPALIEKDINRTDDHDRIINLFVEAPGTLDDKLAIAMRIDTTGTRPNTGGGIINTSKLTTQGKGSIDDLLTAKGPVVDYIKPRLIRMRVYPSTTSAATGDGEAFFLILGANITKRGKGDLNVGESGALDVAGKEVEVKAQGARLKGFGGKGTYGDGATYYKTFNDDLLTIIGPDGSEMLDELCPPTKATAGWANGNAPFNFVGRNLVAMSEVLRQYAKKAGSTPDDVKNMFLGVIKHVYPKITPPMYSGVLKTIDRNCSFDVEEFRKQWFLMTYAYYLETSRDKTGQTYDGILFIHQPSFTYSYVKDASEISKNWDDFELNTSLYNWTDTQSVAPKITYGKEERTRDTKSSTPKSAVKDPEELATQTHKVSGLKPQAAKAAADSLAAKSKEPSPLRARR
jgi:hypothetical protein